MAPYCCVELSSYLLKSISLRACEAHGQPLVQRLGKASFGAMDSERYRFGKIEIKKITSRFRQQKPRGIVDN